MTREGALELRASVVGTQRLLHSRRCVDLVTDAATDAASIAGGSMARVSALARLRRSC